MRIRSTSWLVGQVRRLVRSAGFDLVRYRPPPWDSFPSDLEKSFSSLWGQVHPYTMTSSERGYALHKAILYLVRHNIAGSIVECGVWRGGSMMLAALTLVEASDTTRDLYLFDTFTGMASPSSTDRRAEDEMSAADLLEAADRSSPLWGIASLAEVRTAITATNYPVERIHFVQGRVEETVPKNAPEQIALLRLDTDWYESTKHELIHLVPRLVGGGILIIDDYGYWLGARKAVDEYLENCQFPILLNRIDHSGRIAVMPIVSNPP